MGGNEFLPKWRIRMVERFGASGLRELQAGREGLVEQAGPLPRLELHDLADQAGGSRAVGRSGETLGHPRSQGRIEVSFAIAGDTRDLPEREGVSFRARPLDRE